MSNNFPHNRFAFFIILISVIVGAYLGLRTTPSEAENQTSSILYKIPPTPFQEIGEDLKRLSLEEKVGQLFIVGIPEKTLTTQTKNFLTSYKPGGIILLEKNISNSSTLNTLIKDVQKIGTQKNPFFVSIDQEGGVVSRLDADNFQTTPQKDIPEEMQAYLVARERGEELRALGINMNFSPVLDDGTPNSFLHERLFKGTLEEKGLLGSAMIRGYRDTHIVAVPKHIPPHPDKATDPHEEKIISIESSQLIVEKMLPFKMVHTSVYPSMFMISHVTFNTLDTAPASISKNTINFIRENLSFDGILITDDLEMGALDDIPYTQRAIRALQSGADMVLFSGFKLSPLQHEEIFQSTIHAYQTGQLDTKQLDAKVKKIIQVKKSISQ